MHELSIKQYRPSAYNPESQGALERFHQTLKIMFRSYGFDSEKDWDGGIHLLLLGVKESVQESLGFSPFELIWPYGTRTFETSQKELSLRWWQRQGEIFKPGDRVLALLLIPGKPLQARYYGLYFVHKKINDVNYIINTPGRRKQKQLCHINMLKEYIDRDNSVVTPVNVVNSVPHEQSQMDSKDMNFEKSDHSSSKLQNSDILKDLVQKLSHLDLVKRNELKQLNYEYEHLFPDIPTRIDKVFHDVEIDGSKPVKQHPYRMNPAKQQYLREEIQYLLDNDFTEPKLLEFSLYSCTKTWWDISYMHRLS